MNHRLAVGGLGLTVAAVLAATGCRAVRPGALDEAGLGHNKAHRVTGGQGFRLGTPAPHAVAPPARGAPHTLPTVIRIPGLRHLPTTSSHGGWGPAVPPAHNCSTVSLGPGRGTSMQCIQRSDEVITRSDDRVVRDRGEWPDGDGWSDRDHGRGDKDVPGLGLGHDD